jgi:hypothetical protein
MKEHSSPDNVSLLGIAIAKHKDDIIQEVLHENLTQEEAEKIEREYRPKMRIGWNIMSGGNVPPSNKGKKRHEHSTAMMGKNNPFYGKKHTEKTKKHLSEKKTGSNNHFYGKKRKQHSEIMKEKRGKEYPRFRGYFITPFGKFDSYLEASARLGVNPNSLYSYCIQKNNEKVKPISYSKSSFLKSFDCKENVVGKTYKELGFGFEYV